MATALRRIQRLPRTGFERNNDAELVLSAGNFYQTDDQFNFGGHSNRFAYYASVTKPHQSRLADSHLRGPPDAARLRELHFAIFNRVRRTSFA